MRDEVALPSKTLRVRGILGGILLTIALATGIGAMRHLDNNAHATNLVGVSLIAALIAIIALAPILGRSFIGLVGAPVRRSAVGNLAVENGRRNPRRTAATATALAIGLALMTAIGVLAASTKESVAAVVDDTIGADYIILGANFQPFRPDVYEAVKSTPGTSTVTFTRQMPLRVNDGQGVLTGVQPELFPQVFNLTMESGSMMNLAAGDAIVDVDTAKSAGVKVGDRVPVTYLSGPGTLMIRGTYKPAGPITGWISSVDTLTRAGGQDLDSAIYVKVATGSDPQLVQSSLESTLKDFPAVKLQDQASLKAQINQQFDRVFGFIYALLALAVIVAFLGIVNTLALSVYERRREVGLLRAVGTSRSQIRRMVVLEAVLIALFGSIVGVTLGLIYGVLFRKVLESVGITRLAVPTGQLLWFVAIGVLGGVIAALWPALTASRLDVLKAISSD
jgi:putative ABC transport system permease protein